jgi:hypothetical protein
MEELGKALRTIAHVIGTIAVVGMILIFALLVIMLI